MIAIKCGSTHNTMDLRILPLIAALFLSAGLAAQHVAFPSITGETADGRTVTLPGAGGKAYTVIGLAFSQKASPLLDEWVEPAYLRFVAKHGLFTGTYDCDVYFVPLFVGLDRSAYEPSIRKFRKSASPEVVDLVVFSRTDFDTLKEPLGLDDRSLPYIFVVDRDGHIVHRAKGRFDHDALDAIEEVMMQ